MSSITQQKSAFNIREKLILQLTRDKTWELLGIGSIVLIAALLRFSNLDSLGYVNHYYTAGVKSMLQSWHNFFYVAAEPGGSVSIDKPPVGLWLQAVSAYFLGVNGFSVLLPELLAGTLSVAVLYLLIRRSFGVLSGLLAALILAITPIVVATDRNNTIDSTLILTLLLATWAFIKASETSKLRYLFLGVVLVGIGFNIKMLQAYLPLPAFYGLYFLGSSEMIWRKAGKLLLATILLLTLSLSWSVAVDLTPADQRPYVGSSSDNSELNLIIGYNGLQRLLGMFGRGGFRPVTTTDGIQSDGQSPMNPPAVPPDGNNPNGDGFRPNGNNVMQPGNGPGGFNIGQPGALRFFIAPLSKEVSWLLPFGLISMILLAAGSRWRRPFTQKHQALVLWGLWLLTCLIFFSIAGFFHEYYLSMLGAPLAALVAIALVKLWNLAKEKPLLAASVFVVSAIGTIAFQMYTAYNFMENIWWLPAVIVLITTGIAALIFAIRRKFNLHLTTGFTLMTTAILMTPAIWSVYTVLSASQNQSLPAAYSGGAIGPVEQRGMQLNQSLLDYLQANTQNMKYLMAVPSAMQGADYILATGRPVLYMGGFNGQDQVVTSEDLAQMVSEGELRYVYWSAEGRGPGGTNAEISSWVTFSCTTVPGFDTSTQNAGAPDGTTSRQNNSFSPNKDGPFRGMQVTLYDCASVN